MNDISYEFAHEDILPKVLAFDLFAIHRQSVTILRNSRSFVVGVLIEWNTKYVQFCVRLFKHSQCLRHVPSARYAKAIQ